MWSYLYLRRCQDSINQILGKRLLQAVSTNQHANFSRIAHEVQRSLPGRVAATHHEDFLVGAKLRFTGSRSIVDTRTPQPLFIPKIQAAILHTRGADPGIHHEAGAVRQMTNSLPRQKFSPHAFLQNQDFRTKTAGLLARPLGQFGAADPAWKPQVVLNPGTGARLSPDRRPFDEQSFETLGCSINRSTQPGRPRPQNSEIVFRAGWPLQPT